jgi:hypothetical protein
MGHFSVKISAPTGSILGGNQQAALVTGVDFRWVRPSGRAGLAVAWHGGCRFCARTALAIPARRSVVCRPGVSWPIRECAVDDR